MRNNPADARLLDSGDLARFTALVALLAILMTDGRVGAGALSTTLLAILLTLALLANGSAIDPCAKEAR